MYYVTYPEGRVLHPWSGTLGSTLSPSSWYIDHHCSILGHVDKHTQLKKNRNTQPPSSPNNNGSIRTYLLNSVLLSRMRQPDLAPFRHTPRLDDDQSDAAAEVGVPLGYFLGILMFQAPAI